MAASDDRLHKICSISIAELSKERVHMYDTYYTRLYLTSENTYGCGSLWGVLCTLCILNREESS